MGERRVWDDFITERDRQVYSAGFGRGVGIGENVALISIDVMYKTLGDEPVPVVEAVERYGPGCCGDEGWQALGIFREALDFFHERRLPVIYVLPSPDEQMSAAKKERFDAKMPGVARGYRGIKSTDAVPDIVAPTEQDHIVHKPATSAFFQTNLHEVLEGFAIDTLLMTGNSTSGCVRAAVIDAFGYGYRVIVVEDGVYDRGQASHAINLFDMNAKYADVLPWAEVRSRLESLVSASAQK
jgi:nicotinamidase-related amidase